LQQSPIGHFLTAPGRREDRDAMCTRDDAMRPDARRAAKPAKGAVKRPHGAQRNQAAPAALAQRFVLTVDGAGAYYVYRDAAVSVGPISSAARPDLALMTDPRTPVVSIDRMDGDYFLRSDTPVPVNDLPVCEQLLQANDRVNLSPRCRLTMLKPHAASNTAVLRFSGARLPRADVRSAILMDREILIGASSSCHVPAAGLPGQVALVARDGRLYVRGANQEEMELRPNEPVRVESVTLMCARMESY